MAAHSVAAGGLGSVAAPQASVEPLAYASFFQSDNASSLPVLETGQQWTVLQGIWGTTRYMAYSSAVVQGSVGSAAYVDVGTSSYNAEVTIDSVGAGSAGLTFSIADVNNRMILRASARGTEFLRSAAGIHAILASDSTPLQSGDVLQVERSSGQYVVRLNKKVIITVTDSFNSASTKVGIHSDHPLARLKHFTVDAAPTTTDYVTIASPSHYQIFQRNAAGKADIPVSGSYTGACSAIEARYTGHSSDWTLLTLSPDNTFRGTLVNQNQGQGNVEVRCSSNPAAIDRKRYVGVGDVFLVAGQSNAEGRITSPQFYTHPTMRAGVFDQSGKWREAYDPTDSSLADQYSIWPLLATKIMASQQVPVAFITTAEGSTGLLGNGGTWTKPQGSFNGCVDAVRRSGINGLKAVLWYQGETDAVLALTSPDQYEQPLKKFRADLSTELGFDALKLVAAQIGYVDTIDSTESRVSMDAVRLGTTQAWESDEHIIAGPVLYDLDLSMGAGGDGVHILTPAHGEVEAERWWHMLSFHFYGGTEGRGPRFAHAHQVDGTHVDVGFNLAAGSLQPSEPPVKGWRVVDASGESKVVAARLQNPTTVRLTLEQPLIGPVQISWASYNDAVGSTLTDSSVTAMPAEPFVATVQTAPPPNAPTTYSIKGRVTNGVAPSTRVMLTGTHTLMSGVDAQGNYSFVNLPSGNYLVYARQSE